MVIAFHCILFVVSNLEISMLLANLEGDLGEPANVGSVTVPFILEVVITDSINQEAKMLKVVTALLTD